MASKKIKTEKAVTEVKKVPDLLEALLEEEIKYFLKLIKGPGFKKLVKGEVYSIFEAMSAVTLSDVLSADQIMGIIRRIVIGFTPAGGVPEIAGEMARKVISSEINESTTLDDIFPQAIYDQFAEKAATMDNVRRRVIHRAVHNTAYSRMVCDAIITVVQEYVISDIPIARKIPGFNLLMGIGRGTAKMALPGLWSAIEDTFRDFIEKRVDFILARSESFLLSFLSEERMMEISDEAWKEASGKTLAEHFSALYPADLDELIVVGYEFWLNFRETPYFVTLVDELVAYFFEKYGDREVDLLVEDIGVTREMVVQEVVEFSVLIVKKVVSTGLLEERLRAHLTPFFHGERAAKVLADHAPKA